MITLAEKMAGLSPERRKRVEERANELIAQEHARRARRATKRAGAPGNGLRCHAFGKPYYARKAVKIQIGKRSFRGIRRRSRSMGYRRLVNLAR